MITARMIFDAAQEEANKGTDGSDDKFMRLNMLAKLMAQIEQAEALVRIADALEKMHEV